MGKAREVTNNVRDILLKIAESKKKQTLLSIISECQSNKYHYVHDLVHLRDK